MIRAIASCIVITAMSSGAAYFLGRSHAADACQAEKNKAAANSHRTELRRIGNKLLLNETTGDKVEKKRSRIQTIFQSLDQGARNDARHDVDRCVLPAERLRRWRAANAGTVEAIAAAEPDASAAGAAATGQRQDVRSGSQSQAGGKDVSLAGGTDMRTAAVAGN